MVSLVSESELGEYKDSEIQRWLVGMLLQPCSDRFSFERDIVRGQLGSHPCNVDHRIVTQHTTTNKNHAEQLFYRNTESDRTRRADSNEPTFRV